MKFFFLRKGRRVVTAAILNQQPTYVSIKTKCFKPFSECII